MVKIVGVNEIPDGFFSYYDGGDVLDVKFIIDKVKTARDDGVRDFTWEYDGVELVDFRVSSREIEEARTKVPKHLQKDLKRAADNIRRFALRQKQQFEDFKCEVEPGVFLGQRVVPIERIGVYVPGGRFPLVSSVLMGVIPAQVAGVKQISLCSPPTYQGSVHPAILAAADLLGVKDIYRIGGVQAVAALAFGTETVERVDKIVGPGNRYVTAAKKEVFGQVGIDLLAGPSEILIIADETADPCIVAADLLAQAEHDPLAEAILVTPCQKLAAQVKKELDFQMGDLSTATIARQSLADRGLIVIVNSLDEAINVANKKAPEHLEIQTRENKRLISKLKNYGSLFIGENAAEVLGDYTSGINHTLPTGSASRYSGGLSVRDFLKLQTTLEVSSRGLKKIGPVAKRIAEVEGLSGHTQSITSRLKQSLRPNGTRVK